MGTIASQITSLTISFSTGYSDADQRKHKSAASLAFVRGIHRAPMISPHKWPVTRKMFPFDDVIMSPVNVSTSLRRTDFIKSLILMQASFSEIYWTIQPLHDFQVILIEILYCPACRTSLIATRFWVVVICPIIKCFTVLEFSFILFDLCLFITIFNFILNYVPIVTFWIFPYHKIWILLIISCFICNYWIIYFLTCLEVFWNVVS